MAPNDPPKAGRILCFCCLAFLALANLVVNPTPVCGSPLSLLPHVVLHFEELIARRSQREVGGQMKQMPGSFSPAPASSVFTFSLA